MINGVRYPLELHFVHQAADHSNLVIAVFVQEGKENSYFEKISVFKQLAKNSSENTDIISTLNTFIRKITVTGEIFVSNNIKEHAGPIIIPPF